MKDIKHYISTIDGLAKQGLNENPNPGDFNQAMKSPIGSINYNDMEKRADANVDGENPEVEVHEDDESWKYEGRIKSLETQIGILYKQIEKNNIVAEAEIKSLHKQNENLFNYIQDNHLRINKLEGK